MCLIWKICYFLASLNKASTSWFGGSRRAKPLWHLNIYFATSFCLYFHLTLIQIHTVYPRGLNFGMVDLLWCAEVLVNKRSTSVTSEVKRGHIMVSLSKSNSRRHFSWLLHWLKIFNDLISSWKDDLNLSSEVIWGHWGQKCQFYWFLNSVPSDKVLQPSLGLSIWMTSTLTSEVVWGHRGQKCQFYWFLKS